MSSQDTVTERDLLCLLQLVDQAREQRDTWSFPAVVLAGLQQLIPCADIMFQLADPSGARTSADSTSMPGRCCTTCPA